MLTVEDVSKTYDGFKAITNLTFYLFDGELRTVIGPNGAGKSTFFDLITGRAKPDKGKIEFGFDTDLTVLNEYEINRLGIGCFHSRAPAASLLRFSTVFRPPTATVSMSC